MNSTRNSKVPVGAVSAQSRKRIRIAPLAAFLAIVPTLCDPAPAQVPAGSAVVGTFAGPSSQGTAGLFLVSLPGGGVTPVTGLPAHLSATGPTATPQGVASLAYDSASGAIVVGTVAAAAGPTTGNVDLFVFYLNGSAIDPARTRQIYLGTTGGVSGALVATMPDGRILVTAGDGASAFATGPMANHLFAIVDISAPIPAFTLLPTPPGSGVGGGMAVDPTGRFIYYLLTTSINTAGRIAHLHRWEIATNTGCVVATFPGQWARGLAVDDDGTVYVSANDGTGIAHVVHTVQPDGCNPGVVASMPSSLPLGTAGFGLDRASGRRIVTSGFAPGFPSTYVNSLSLVDAAGTASVIASPPPGGWGLMSASVAVNNSLQSYGPRSDGDNRHWFDNFPNPGGEPTIGNSTFSLTMRSEPGVPVLSFLALALERDTMTVAGIEVLVDVNTVATMFFVPGPSVTYSWPMPNNPAFRGVVLRAQSLHLEPNNALSASRGLTITLQ